MPLPGSSSSASTGIFSLMVLFLNPCLFVVSNKGGFAVHTSSLFILLLILLLNHSLKLSLNSLIALSIILILIWSANNYESWTWIDFWNIIWKCLELDFRILYLQFSFCVGNELKCCLFDSFNQIFWVLESVAWPNEHLHCNGEVSTESCSFP